VRAAGLHGKEQSRRRCGRVLLSGESSSLDLVGWEWRRERAQGGLATGCRPRYLTSGPARSAS
jgi:hypothetical protein